MDGASQTIVGVAQSERRLSTLVQAVTAADLGMTLEGEGPFTVFAPTTWSRATSCPPTCRTAR